MMYNWSDCCDCRRQHCANRAEIQRAINSRRNAASGHIENHKHLPHSAENLASELIRLPLPEQKLGINKPELVDQMSRPRKFSWISTQSMSAFSFASSDIALQIGAELGAMVVNPVQDNLPKGE